MTGFLHFMIDVVSQYARGVRTPSKESTYYYGMNTAYAFGQIMFGALGLILALKVPHLMVDWPIIALTIVAAAVWLGISFVFLPYKEPKFISSIFSLLVITAAAFTF